MRRARQGKGAEKVGRNEKAVSAQEDSILLKLGRDSKATSLHRVWPGYILADTVLTAP